MSSWKLRKAHVIGFLAQPGFKLTSYPVEAQAAPQKLKSEKGKLQKTLIGISQFPEDNLLHSMPTTEAGPEAERVDPLLRGRSKEFFKSE